jgi:hypothetical protein
MFGDLIVLDTKHVKPGGVLWPLFTCDERKRHVTLATKIAARPSSESFTGSGPPSFSKGALKPAMPASAFGLCWMYSACMYLPISSSWRPSRFYHRPLFLHVDDVVHMRFANPPKPDFASVAALLRIVGGGPGGGMGACRRNPLMARPAPNGPPPDDPDLAAPGGGPSWGSNCDGERDAKLICRSWIFQHFDW